MGQTENSPAAVLVVGEGELADEIAAALGVGSATPMWSWPDGSAESADVPESLDLLVYVCACRTDPVALVDQSEQQWIDECEAVLASAVAALTDCHAPLRAAAGQVVFVIPSFAMSGAKGFAAAAAAAEGLRGMVKSTAKQWGQDGIRVNTVALDPSHFVPGETGRDLSSVMGLAVSSGFGHAGDIAIDIAPAIELLQNREAGFLTGATLTLDGGVWMAS